MADDQSTHDDPGQAIKQAETELAHAGEQSKQLEKKIKDAEAKRPEPIDHANDGGVI